MVAIALLLSSTAAAISLDHQSADASSTGAAVACDNLRVLAVNDTLEQSTLQPATNAEWLKFTVQQDARYRLEVDKSGGLQLTLHGRCSEKAPAVELHNGQLEFTATRDGDYYLLIRGDGLSSAGASGYQVTLSLAAPHPAKSTGLADVPEALQRRAVEFLEELRGSDLAPEWRDARLHPEPHPLYRPDIRAPAYYEFPVVKPTGTGYYEPAGFIQLATGDHDYVITLWDMTGRSPTQELADLAPRGVVLTKFYRLNSLSYAAEYEEYHLHGIAVVADDVINLGDLPNRIEGLDAIPEEPAELVTETIDSAGNREYEGPEELPLLEESSWDSWAALKDGYAEEYAPLLASLEQRASEEWELERNVIEYGESLVKGDVRTVYGLPSRTLHSIKVEGDPMAIEYLQQEQLSDEGTLTGLRLTVLDEPTDPDGYLRFVVKLEYTNDATEAINYAIVNAAALNIYDVYLPFISAGTRGTLVSGGSAEGGTSTASWGPWTYYWADGSNIAAGIKYGQFSYKGCASGCGATAWAMVFGYVDRLAALGHHVWAPHWGIYRVDGGLGADAVAPLTQDEGVRNMTREIRDHINTYCSGSQGSTKFTSMINA